MHAQISIDDLEHPGPAMEMDVLVPPQASNFNFDSGCSSPYMTAPSSPQRFGNFFFFSAPASPTRRLINNNPFETQETRTYKDGDGDGDGDDDEEQEDFAFDYSGPLVRTSFSAADELFAGGKIRPLNSCPSVHRGRTSEPSSHSTSTTVPKSSSSSSGFLSMFSSASLSRGYRKLKLKELLLFRSWSEGRATGKDGADGVSRNSSFRSRSGGVGSGSGSVSGSIRRLRVSAHELHYMENRAASEEMKKKTFLPYKQGLLGCMGFSHGVHDKYFFSKGIGSWRRE